MSYRNPYDIYEGMAKRISLIKYNKESRWGLIHSTHKLSSYVSDPSALANQLNLAWPMFEDEIIILPLHLHNAEFIQDVLNAIIYIYQENGWDVS